jgi:hypothetical protein
MKNLQETPTDDIDNLSKPAASVDAILDEVVSDVTLPSAVADMPQENIAGVAGSNGVTGRSPELPATPAMFSQLPNNNINVKPETRGRKKKPRDANGKIIQDGEAKPKPAVEGLGKTVHHETAAIDPAAEVAVMMVNVSGQMLAGAEGKMTQDEAMLAKGGFVAYFKAKGVSNVPPWVVLAGALAPYYMRVFNEKPARSKIKTLAEKAYFGFSRIFGRVKDARFNSRDNNVRQNDTSEKASEKSK